MDLLKIIQSINLKNVGLNYDIGNSAGNKYNFNLEKYFKHVKNIHLKDKDAKQKVLGWAMVMQILKIFLDISKKLSTKERLVCKQLDLNMIFILQK